MSQIIFNKISSQIALVETPNHIKIMDWDSTAILNHEHFQAISVEIQIQHVEYFEVIPDTIPLFRNATGKGLAIPHHLI